MEKIERNVCIIIINYFNNSDTSRCMRSILDTASDELPYIVIVDNSGAATSLEDEILFYPDHRYLLPGKNLGFAAGNNFGIEWAFENLSFSYLFILNNDTTIRKGTIENLIQASLRNSGVKVFAPCIITEEVPATIWYAGGDLNYFKMTPVINKIGKQYNFEIIDEEITFFASGCAIFLVVKTNWFGKKLFDPEFFMYDEDLELMIRLKNRNEKVLLVGNSIVVHKCQGSQKKDTLFSINQLSPRNSNLSFYLSHTIQNRYYILEKHFKGLRRKILWSSLTVYWLLKSLHFFLGFDFKNSRLVLKILTGRMHQSPSRIKWTGSSETEQ